MELLLQETRKLIDSLPEKIKKSAFKPKSIMKMTGIPSATFYNRMKYRNFTFSEVEKIVKILEFEKKIEEYIRSGEVDIKKGKTLTIQEIEEKYS